MLWTGFRVLIVVACIVRVLLRENRDPASRMAWIVVILALPVIGVIAYLLIGETSIGRKRTERLSKVITGLPGPDEFPDWEADAAHKPISDRAEQMFNVGMSISGYSPVGGNHGRLLKDSNAVIDEMVADIDAAEKHVHLMFYIWLTDNNGLKMVEALKRAVARGVTCRAMVDDLGSRDMIKSSHWADMGNAGVKLAIALKIGNPIFRIFDGRLDLRDHRKILVIDNKVTYCGSQNCADPEFLPKAKFGPWVDAVMRFEGPVVRQNQHLFASDWMANSDDDVREVLREPLGPQSPGFTAQVVASGPTVRHSAMPEMFESLMYAAHHELVITTPYYVPDAAIQAGLCAAANRGVAVRLVLPARNDDFAVGATSRSYYRDLLIAGVKIYEFQPGLLHTKSMTVDGQITLIGSANMDQRSFDLNYENNILLHDLDLTAQMLDRQNAYVADSTPVLLSTVEDWPRGKRLWNNALAIVGPLL